MSFRWTSMEVAAVRVRQGKKLRQATYHPSQESVGERPAHLPSQHGLSWVSRFEKTSSTSLQRPASE